MPNLNTAEARELRKVRCTFSGALSDLTTGTNGALNPANWTIAGQVTGLQPAAPVTPTLVEQISTSIVDVTSDTELTPGMIYQITAKSSADGGIAGVPASPNNKATFTALVPSAPSERSFAVLDMVPSLNIREDDTGELRRFLNVLQDPLTLLLHDIDHWPDIFDYDLADENFLDLMLQDLGYPYEIVLTKIDKARLLSVLLTIYKQKGTVVGIKNAIRFFLGYECDVLSVDNSNYGGWTLGDSELDVDTSLGDAYYYNSTIHGPDVGGLARPWQFYVKIGTVGGAALTVDETAKAETIINYMKPLETTLISVSSTLEQPKNVVATPGTGQVSISWGAVTGAVGYTVFWSKTPIVTPLSLNGQVDPDNVSPFVLSGVPAGEERYLIVCARTALGRNGVASVVVSATAV